MTDAARCHIGVLVVGYGNPLRRDDGLGPFLVDGLGSDNGSGIETLTCVQLLPELAASLAEAETAIFVDARAAGAEMELTLLEEGDAAAWSSHAADPCALLALTRAVYGRCPRVWWLTVPGADFGIGEGLSPTARENARMARECLEELLSRAGASQ